MTEMQKLVKQWDGEFQEWKNANSIHKSLEGKLFSSEKQVVEKVRKEYGRN